jgi:hypothetical protein
MSGALTPVATEDNVWNGKEKQVGVGADLVLQKAVDKIAPKAKEPEPEPKADLHGNGAIQCNALAANAQAWANAPARPGMTSAR